MEKMIGLAVLLALLANDVAAANYPCSGGKGGVARCDGELFVCNDGSISASKRNCAAENGWQNGAASKSESVKIEPFTGSAGACPCGAGVLCTGPRGGQYCTTPSGGKSYKRR